MDSYWRQRLYDILSQVGKVSSSEILNLWNEVLDDMYGEDSERKKAVLDVAIQDDKISSDARKWLKSLV